MKKRMLYILLAVACAALLFYAKERGSKHTQYAPESVAASGLMDFAAGIETSLNAYIKRRGLSSEGGYLSRLDFSEPSSSPCKGDTKFRVFQCDVHNYSREDINVLQLRYNPPPPSQFSKDGGRYYFSLGNRVEGQGTDLPELLMIATHPLRSVCGAINKGLGLDTKGGIPKLAIDISLTPNTEPVAEGDIATLPPYKGACYEGASGTLYYISVLVAQ